jgi:hypothetical protein
MALPKTLTAANCQLTLFALPYLPVPTLIEGFASDAAFLFDTPAVAEAMKGVDGKLSAGFLPSITRQTITLQADSVSNRWFNDLFSASKAAREIAWLYGSIALPSEGFSYTLTKGVLEQLTQAPPVGKVLQPRTFQIAWDDIQPVPLVVG